MPLKRKTIPWAITSLRVIALPFLLYSFNQQIQVVTYALFLFARCTDCVDGYAAKKLEATSRLGSYFDVTADFILVSGMFVMFVLEEVYPLWILLLIVAVFVQFVLTSLYSKQTIYDPVGKYYGSLMYCGIGLTLLFSEQLTFNIVTIGIVVSTIVSLFSRLVYFLRAQNRK
ncbi:MAG: CDP-alcohol phosphatidyltransferase family protein [Candidatus Bathyarchaeum sp.]|nr:MAG: CDP-alcohol phosphatidyltransferase family protein [Candidatus Bathyarchaeum sp.]